MKNSYESPFSTRYAGDEMQRIFSADNKFKTWRRLWLALARAQMKLGLPITNEQIDELEQNIDNIDYDIADRQEKLTRHDVLSHVYAYGVQCPNSKEIIHLGATSSYVVDNTDIIIMRDGLRIIRRKLINIIHTLSDFAEKYKALPALSYTHLQPAQLTTIGKRATIWINELLMDLSEIEYRIDNLQLLGSKGTTGTQASYVELFDGDVRRIKKLDEYIAFEMGFDKVIPVSGQTYSRKIDAQILSALSSVAQSASKFSNDLRLLQGFKEMEEPFEDTQIGSWETPYKRIPMRSERITALSRYVIVDCLNPAFTAGTQWLERTLDDSANKRISIAEAFLAVDSIMNIMLNVCTGLIVYPKIINQRIMKELPFLAFEKILSAAIKKGGNKDLLSKRLRDHSVEAVSVIKEQGLENDLVERICNDGVFNLSKEEIDEILIPKNFIGRSISQVEEFISVYVKPVREANLEILGENAELSV